MGKERLPEKTTTINETAKLLNNEQDKSIDEAGITEKIKEDLDLIAGKMKDDFDLKKREREFAELEIRIDRKLEELKKSDVGGRSEAGYIPKKLDPEQARKDRANAFLKTTGLKI